MECPVRQRAGGPPPPLRAPQAGGSRFSPRASVHALGGAPLLARPRAAHEPLLRHKHPHQDHNQAAHQGGEGQRAGAAHLRPRVQPLLRSAGGAGGQVQLRAGGGRLRQHRAMLQSRQPGVSNARGKKRAREKRGQAVNMVPAARSYHVLPACGFPACSEGTYRRSGRALPGQGANSASPPTAAHAHPPGQQQDHARAWRGFPGRPGQRKGSSPNPALTRPTSSMSE